MGIKYVMQSVMQLYLLSYHLVIVVNKNYQNTLKFNLKQEKQIVNCNIYFLRTVYMYQSCLRGRLQIFWGNTEISIPPPLAADSSFLSSSLALLLLTEIILYIFTIIESEFFDSAQMVEIWSCWTRKYIARPSYLGFIGTVFSPQVASTRTFENVFPKLRDNSDKAILTERDLIVHNFGILLMNSNCFAIFFSSILVMSVQISILLLGLSLPFKRVLKFLLSPLI